MIILYLLKGIGFGLIGSVGLGPITILIINRTLNRGVTSGFVSGVGSALSDGIYATFAAFGISLIIDLLNQYRGWFQVGVMIVLFVIGSSILFFRPVPRNIGKPEKKSLRSDFFTSWLLAISNPFMVLVFMGLFGFFNVLEGNPDWLKTVILLGGVFIGANTYWFILTRIIKMVGQRIQTTQLRYINITAGIVMVILGLISGIKALNSLIV